MSHDLLQCGEGTSGHSNAQGDTVPQHTVEQYPIGGGEGNDALEASEGEEWKKWTCFINGRELVTVATPTAASAADQSITLSWLLVLRFLALPAPYPPAHTSDTTSTSRL